MTFTVYREERGEYVGYIEQAAFTNYYEAGVYRVHGANARIIYSNTFATVPNAKRAIKRQLKKIEENER